MISHLLLADDTSIFGRADSKVFGSLQEVLALYSAASGQLVNFQKSAIVFSLNDKSYLIGYNSR